jgi:G3E family GTPase
VDGVNLPDQLKTLKEPEKQLAIADRIFITKTDLISPSQLNVVNELIRSINPSSPIKELVYGNIDPNELMGIGLSSTKASEKTLSFLGENQSQLSEKYLGDFANRHSSNIKTETLRFTTPFTWEAFSSALDLLTTLRGVDLLRVKGIINVEDKPIVIQGVQHIFHPPVTLDRWPSEDHDSRIVFITRNIPKEVLRNLFEIVTQVVKTA